MKENIQEIQELYKDKERQEKEGRIEDEEVILIRPYEAFTATSSSISQTSFITEEVENLSKYMKFVQTPSQTRIFRPPPHYQSLKSRGEQDLIFWKEMATTFVETKYNTDTSKCSKEARHTNPISSPSIICNRSS